MNYVLAMCLSNITDSDFILIYSIWYSSFLRSLGKKGDYHRYIRTFQTVWVVGTMNKYK